MDLIRELLYTEVLFYIQIRDVTNIQGEHNPIKT